MLKRLFVGCIPMLAVLWPTGAAAQSGDEGTGDDATSFLGVGAQGGEQPAGEATEPPAGGEAGAGETPPAGTAGGETPEGGEGTSEQAAWLQGQEQGPVIAAPEEDPELRLIEDPEEAYFLVGLRSHAVFVPDFLIKAFGLAEAPGVIGWALGPEFTFRRNGFDIVGSVWWASYPGEGPVREEGDLAEETEVIRSTLGLVWITADFLGSYDFKPWVGLTYGGGVGIGITTGAVNRKEAYPAEGGGWAACDGPGDPNLQYCESREDGGHYQDVDWGFKGLWRVYPQVRGIIGVRFKPLRNLVITPEFGVGLPELFQLGARFNYMF
jgi:hypothetical protein